MNTLKLAFVSLVLFASGTSALANDYNPPDARVLKIGDSAPDFSLPGVDGKTHSLAEFKSDILMVIFLSNHCPDSHAVESRLFKFIAEMKGKSFSVVAINPNNPKGLTIDELGYSKYSDSFDEMKLYAKERGFPFPYLNDGDTQKTAKAYGALATPHVFVFDRDRKLRYQGQFDDSRFPDPATVKRTDGPNAIRALLAGTPVPVELTKPHGCSIKWIEKNAAVKEFNAKWENTPVTLELIDPAAVEKLARNNTDKYRIVNVWATWCAPCVEEFPSLVSVGWRLSMRPVELVTISMDNPKQTAAAQKFLQKNHAGVPGRLVKSLKEEGRTTNNYVFTDPSNDVLIKALDPVWAGPLPHTVIIAPGGKIVYRKTGILDPQELYAKMLELLTPYY
ncbi:MAG TPA: redoxin domain-containing protein [Lacunisphaera sp.]|jgi:peroxiredoxin